MPRAGATFQYFRAARTALLCSAATLVALSATSPALAATYLWTGGNTNWDIPTNWSPAGEPGATDTANIFDGSGPLVTSTGNNVSILNIRSAAGTPFTISGGGALNVGTRVLLGQNNLQTGSALVTGTNSLLATKELNIAESGIGILNVLSGGRVTATNVHLGLNPSGSGTLLVDGAGSSLNSTTFMRIGSAGTGQVTVQNGATVNVTGGTGIIVGEAGTGALSVLSGGKVTTTQVRIGNLTDSTGAVIVDGTGSTFGATGSFYVGAAGTGTMNITNGGTVTGGTTIVGQAAGGGTSTVTIDGAGSTWTTAGLTVGSGHNGEVFATDGAVINSSGGTIGSSNGTGFMELDNSTWNAQNASGQATIGVGAGNTGTLRLLNGSHVQTSNRLTVGGSNTSGVGTMLVDNSTFTLLPQTAGVQANTAEIGRDGGTGFLTIQNGSTFDLNDAQFQLGTRNTQSEGTLLVQDAGTTVTSGLFTVGQNGAGHFQLLDGAVMNTGNFASGGNASAIATSDSLIDSATLNITGTGVVPAARIGIGGTASMTIQNGGVVDVNGGTGNVEMAINSGSVGTLNIQTGGGVTGQFLAGTINGGDGDATINIDHADAAYLFSPVMTGNLDVNLTGGGTTIFTGDSTYAGLTTIASGTTLQLGNGGTSGGIQSEILNNGELIVDRSNTYIFSNVITGSGHFTQRGAGATVFTQDQQYTGGTTVEHGYLVLGQNTTTGSVIGDITTTNGDARVYFNRSNLYTFNNLITGPGTFVQQGQGITEFTNAQTYTGETFVVNGGLRLLVANAIITSSNTVVGPGSTIFQAGNDQTLANLVNLGWYSLAGSNLTITGNLSGAGDFFMSSNVAALTGDHIDVQGASSGAYRLAVLNAGGTPADLAASLELVQTTDSSTGGATFSLIGGTVDAGVYAYQLVRGNGSVSMPDINAWYLTLSADDTNDIIHAIVGTAAGMSNIWFSQMDNLHRRMGKQRLVDPAIHKNECWVRGYGRDELVGPGVTGRPFEELIGGMDAGCDRVLSSHDGQTWIGGAFAGYGGARRFFNDFGSSGTTSTPYAGLYATWFNDTNYYADFTAKLQRFDNAFDAKDGSGNIHSGAYTDYGYGGSAEIGRRFDVGGGWVVQPQAQLQYVHISGNAYTTQRGIAVSVGPDDVWQMRGGLEVGKVVPEGNGQAYYYYGRASLIEQTSNGGIITAADLDTLTFDPNLDGLQLEFGVGAIFQMDDQRQGYIALTSNIGQAFTIPWAINAGYRVEF